MQDEDAMHSLGWRESAGRVRRSMLSMWMGWRVYSVQVAWCRQGAPKLEDGGQDMRIAR